MKVTKNHWLNRWTFCTRTWCNWWMADGIIMRHHIAIKFVLYIWWCTMMQSTIYWLHLFLIYNLVHNFYADACLNHYLPLGRFFTWLCSLIKVWPRLYFLQGYIHELLLDLVYIFCKHPFVNHILTPFKPVKLSWQDLIALFDFTKI